MIDDGFEKLGDTTYVRWPRFECETNRSTNDERARMPFEGSIRSLKVQSRYPGVIIEETQYWRGSLANPQIACPVETHVRNTDEASMKGCYVSGIGTSAVRAIIDHYDFDQPRRRRRGPHRL